MGQVVRLAEHGKRREVEEQRRRAQEALRRSIAEFAKLRDLERGR